MHKLSTKATATALEPAPVLGSSRSGVARPGSAGPAARYRRLLQRAGALAFELGPDGTVVFVNDAALTLTGYRPDELLGRPLWALLCPGPQSGQLAELYSRLAV